MIFLFPRWDMLIPWRVCVVHRNRDVKMPSLVISFRPNFAIDVVFYIMWVLLHVVIETTIRLFISTHVENPFHQSQQCIWLHESEYNKIYTVSLTTRFEYALEISDSTSVGTCFFIMELNSRVAMKALVSQSSCISYVTLSFPLLPSAFVWRPIAAFKRPRGKCGLMCSICDVSNPSLVMWNVRFLLSIVWSSSTLAFCESIHEYTHIHIYILCTMCIVYTIFNQSPSLHPNLRKHQVLSPRRPPETPRRGGIDRRLCILVVINVNHGVECLQFPVGCFQK